MGPFAKEYFVHFKFIYLCRVYLDRIQGAYSWQDKDLNLVKMMYEQNGTLKYSIAELNEIQPKPG